jgi:hypothetical protein
MQCSLAGLANAGIRWRRHPIRTTVVEGEWISRTKQLEYCTCWCDLSWYDQTGAGTTQGGFFSLQRLRCTHARAHTHTHPIELILILRFGPILNTRSNCLSNLRKIELFPANVLCCYTARADRLWRAETVEHADRESTESLEEVVMNELM